MFAPAAPSSLPLPALPVLPHPVPDNLPRHPHSFLPLFCLPWSTRFESFGPITPDNTGTDSGSSVPAGTFEAWRSHLVIYLHINLEPYIVVLIFKWPFDILQSECNFNTNSFPTSYLFSVLSQQLRGSAHRPPKGFILQ